MTSPPKNCLLAGLFLTTLTSVFVMSLPCRASAQTLSLVQETSFEDYQAVIDAQGLDATDVFSTAVASLHGQGATVASLRDVEVTIFPQTWVYPGAEAVFLLTDRLAQYTCPLYGLNEGQFMDNCEFGDFVTGTVTKPPQAAFRDAWNSIIDILMLVEFIEGFDGEFDVGSMESEEVVSCQVVSCRQLRVEATSMSRAWDKLVNLEDSEFYSLIGLGFVVGGATSTAGAAGVVGLLHSSGVISFAGVAASNLAFNAILAGAAVWVVGGALTAAALVWAYREGIEFPPFSLLGMDRCPACGISGTPYEGWTSIPAAQRCVSPKCPEAMKQPGDDQGGGGGASNGDSSPGTTGETVDTGGNSTSSHGSGTGETLDGGSESIGCGEWAGFEVDSEVCSVCLEEEEPTTAGTSDDDEEEGEDGGTGDSGTLSSCSVCLSGDDIGTVACVSF